MAIYVPIVCTVIFFSFDTKTGNTLRKKKKKERFILYWLHTVFLISVHWSQKTTGYKWDGQLTYFLGTTFLRGLINWLVDTLWSHSPTLSITLSYFYAVHHHQSHTSWNRSNEVMNCCHKVHNTVLEVMFEMRHNFLGTEVKCDQTQNLWQVALCTE